MRYCRIGLCVGLLLLVLPACFANAQNFGESLNVTRSLGLGPINDVVVDGEFAYAIGRGRVSLSVLDISDRARPKVMGTIGGLGKTRQMVVQEGVAYVGSREDGLFIVDVSAPARPRLLKHYDTLEFATGMAISGDVLFVACRHYGVELIDVRDPANPVHLSSIRTGEAQSVDVRGDVLCVGVWASSEVVMVDVKNPSAPVITERVALDGFGDGVDVVGDYLYASTGHHSKAQPRKVMGDPGFGKGHGLEIFRLNEVGKPVFLSRVKFPLLYERGNDTWRVRVANGRAFCADTYNGMFVVDVRNPAAPKFVARCELPIDKKDQRPGFVGGLWPVKDFVYIAGGNTDLHIVKMAGVATDPDIEKEPGPAVKNITRKSEDAKQGSLVYLPQGQVHAVDFLDNRMAVAACGAAGAHLVEIGQGLNRLSELKTDGFATDVAIDGDHILVAEGFGGLSICQIENGGSLVRVGRYREPRTSIRQVEVVGRFAFIVDGGTRVRMLDLSDPKTPHLVMTDHQSGLLYGDQLMRGTMEKGRYAAAFWHVSGLHWYDLEAGPVHSGDNWPARFGSPNGLFSLQDQVLVTTRRGYMLVAREERRALGEVPLYRIGDKPFHLGKPTVFEDRLYCADRASGMVTVADVSDLKKPEMIEQFVLEGNPGRIAVNQRWVAIPAGVSGLLVLER